MSPLLRSTALAAALAVAAGTGLPAQPANPKNAAARRSGEDKTRFTLDVNRVDIVFTVTDKRGRFITDLTAKDFELTDEKRPQKILGFTAQSNLPLRIALLLDTSNSIRDRFRFIQQAAVDFISSVLRPGGDKIMLATFDNDVEVVSEFTDDAARLSAAVRDLHPGRGTSLYEAIHFVCREKLAKEKPRHDLRRAIILLSDGEDTMSGVARGQAIEEAHKADVVIHSISTNASPPDTHGDKVMKLFAEETGGVVFFPFKSGDLGKSFENLARELRHQYNVYYRPESLDSPARYHAIDLRVVGRKNLVVRSRKGYYVP